MCIVALLIMFVFSYKIALGDGTHCVQMTPSKDDIHYDQALQIAQDYISTVSLCSIVSPYAKNAYFGTYYDPQTSQLMSEPAWIIDYRYKTDEACPLSQAKVYIHRRNGKILYHEQYYDYFYCHADILSLTCSNIIPAEQLISLDRALDINDDYVRQAFGQGTFSHNRKDISLQPCGFCQKETSWIIRCDVQQNDRLYQTNVHVNASTGDILFAAYQETSVIQEIQRKPSTYEDPMRDVDHRYKLINRIIYPHVMPGDRRNLSVMIDEMIYTGIKGYSLQDNVYISLNEVLDVAGINTVCREPGTQLPRSIIVFSFDYQNIEYVASYLGLSRGAIRDRVTNKIIFLHPFSFYNGQSVYIDLSICEQLFRKIGINNVEIIY